MPILTRQPEAMDTEAMHHVSVPRRRRASIGTATTPARALLPAAGPPVPAPVPAPTRALALDALRLLQRLRDPAMFPERWRQVSFRREIELVRTHLTPVRSRRILAASYGREAFHLALEGAERDDPGAVRFAYALRWLELGDRDVRSIWPPAADPSSHTTAPA